MPSDDFALTLRPVSRRLHMSESGSRATTLSIISTGMLSSLGRKSIVIGYALVQREYYGKQTEEVDISLSRRFRAVVCPGRGSKPTMTLMLVIANIRLCSEGGAEGSCWSPLHGSQYLTRDPVHVGYFPMVAWLGCMRRLGMSAADVGYNVR